MPKTNAIATAKLPKADKKPAEAYIIQYEANPKSEQRLWTFQYNPSLLKFSGEAKYSAAETMATRLPDQQFANSTGLKLDISNIYLETFRDRKSLLPLIDGINELRKAKLEKRIFSPPLLMFIFGSRRFGPCVLTSVSWDEASWLGGAPARVQMNLSFMEVPKPGAIGVKALPPEPDPPKDGKPAKDLTDRQKDDAIVKAKEWLKTNEGKLDPRIVTTLKANTFKLEADKKSGDVMMLDAKGGKIGVVGRWDGKTFTTEKVNTIPKKPEAKKEEKKK
jgi:hypothetical protein